MAGKAKIKNYLKYNRFELAEKLGIEIPKPKQKAPLIKIPFRRVRIIMTGKLSQPLFKIFYEKKTRHDLRKIHTQHNFLRRK